MTRTLEEVKEFLKSNASEEDILDVLNLETEQLVERFDDLIDEKFDAVLDYFGLEKQEEEEDEEY